jgi:hypothetical protein
MKLFLIRALIAYVSIAFAVFVMSGWQFSTHGHSWFGFFTQPIPFAILLAIFWSGLFLVLTDFVFGRNGDVMDDNWRPYIVTEVISLICYLSLAFMLSYYLERPGQPSFSGGSNGTAWVVMGEFTYAGLRNAIKNISTATVTALCIHTMGIGYLVWPKKRPISKLGNKPNV